MTGLIQPRDGDPQTWDERAVVVCGTAGGVGTSVVSALLAEHRAASSLGLLSWWVDASGNDCDIELRLRGTGNEELLRTASGTGLWLSPEEAAVTDAVVEVWRQGAVPVVDAGAHPLTLLPELAEDDLPNLTPVLVISPRPDLLNRARIIFTEWDRAGVLEHTVVVIGSQLPVPQQKGLADMLVGVVSGAVGTVIGLDYDPVIGAGTALDQDARRGLLPATAEAIAKLAAATSNQR
ncbi:hypothetical protein [Gordonia amicalis]|uniref:hypothetical protein n=1 Tax=Gordonia amicalis TaxID=89053 RepID=UPI0002A6533C|nr:hypothetical protein [Gordonia amicalis]MBA5846008.1 hypothetical protein [Gordonia amicalis]MDV7101637.1 hypothetical protein [Gordonia amicalis]MDV7172708.1 hypothetical protein [Gordonia amicalis]NKX77148.1 hypothetical protein [Gordonia amicalis]GAC52038.1 hypothetical protein GOAMI_07_00420 [Gordonia amicalis NBRC 100051 = JCM 11271]